MKCFSPVEQEGRHLPPRQTGQAVSLILLQNNWNTRDVFPHRQMPACKSFRILYQFKIWASNWGFAGGCSLFFVSLPAFSG